MRPGAVVERAVMHGRVRALLGSTLVLLALAVRAEEADPSPSPELLEFLGTWSGEEADGDWLDILDGVLREPDEPPVTAPAADAGDDHVPH